VEYCGCGAGLWQRLSAQNAWGLVE